MEPEKGVFASQFHMDLDLTSMCEYIHANVYGLVNKHVYFLSESETNSSRKNDGVEEIIVNY